MTRIVAVDVRFCHPYSDPHYCRQLFAAVTSGPEEFSEAARIQENEVSVNGIQLSRSGGTWPYYATGLQMDFATVSHDVESA